MQILTFVRFEKLNIQGERAMSSEQAETFTHRQMAVKLFNFTWDLMEKAERTQAEEDTMLNAAHASRYHWSEAGTAVNLARGDWQISRVYTVLKRPEPALYHAQRCLDICLENNFGDFDLAYAYEALARASALAGNLTDARNYFLQAVAAGEKIAEADDRQLFDKDMQTLQHLKTIAND